MRILVHVCCAPCFTHPHKRLEEEGHEVTGFFYNPNIHPYQEYRSRRDALEKYVEFNAAKVIYKDGYDIEGYLRSALGAKDRCMSCYTLRLAETAKTARSLGFDAFTTTLLISPYQKHEMIAEVGKKIADENGIEFYYEDFREGYREVLRMHIQREREIFQAVMKSVLITGKPWLCQFSMEYLPADDFAYRTRSFKPLIHRKTPDVPAVDAAFGSCLHHDLGLFYKAFCGIARDFRTA